MEDLAEKFMQLMTELIAKNKAEILAENKKLADEDVFLSVKEAAKYAGKSMAQIRKMCEILIKQNPHRTDVKNFGLYKTKAWSIKKSALDNWQKEVPTNRVVDITVKKKFVPRNMIAKKKREAGQAKSDN